mmetsp:Transcript_33594/g.100030  ORF Transcript_33594/g.100030 Transcript_33594/m.100030 type:complete len:271 (-) Transcript_33594:124-936(-)
MLAVRLLPGARVDPRGGRLFGLRRPTVPDVAALPDRVARAAQEAAGGGARHCHLRGLLLVQGADGRACGVRRVRPRARHHRPPAAERCVLHADRDCTVFVRALHPAQVATEARGAAGIPADPIVLKMPLPAATGAAAQFQGNPHRCLLWCSPRWRRRRRRTAHRRNLAAVAVVTLVNQPVCRFGGAAPCCELKRSDDAGVLCTGRVHMRPAYSARAAYAVHKHGSVGGAVRGVRHCTRAQRGKIICVGGSVRGTRLRTCTLAIGHPPQPS